MNKKYIDFIPTHKAMSNEKKPAKVGHVYTVVPKSNIQRRVAVSDKIEFGVIQDLGDDHGGGDVEKRPLNNKATGKVQTGPLMKDSGKVTTKESETRKGTFKIPSNPFINQEKVVKRPLSGNAYQKESTVSKEEKKGPVTIITKPKKDSKISLVITIIITIILGAVAGTVAFLLLPK